jgi:TonB-dependent starch-binding outer membrane protein SusC
MKLTTVFLMFGLVSVTASTYSQSTRLDINLKDGTMVDLIQQIEKNSEFFFYYQKEELKELDQINLEANNATIMDILDKALQGSEFSYSVLDRYIVIRKKDESFGKEILSAANAVALAQQRSVSGTVT